MNQRLRVGIYLFFARGGIARYTLELLRELAGRQDLWIELACQPGVQPCGRAEYAVWPGLRSLDHPWPLRRRLQFLLAQWTNPARFCRRAEQRGYDIVHFCEFNHLTYPLWARAIRAGGRKVVASVHDVTRAKSLVNRRYEDSQLRRFYRDADALLVHSRKQAAELVDWAGVDPQRVHVVPFGPFDYGPPSADRQQLRHRYGIPEQKVLALSFGNIRDDKKLDVLLRALAADRGDVHLLVAGRAPARGHRPLAYYHQLCEELGVHDAVTFLNRYLPDPEVADVFTMCDFVALPYSASFTSHSGIIGVAARYRRPVLASATATFEELLSDHDIGVLVQPDDPKSLAEGIQRIVQLTRNSHPFRFDDFLRTTSWRCNAEFTANLYWLLARCDNGQG